MSVDPNTFEGRLQNLVKSWPFYPNIDAELNAIRIALGADTTTRDATLQLPPVGLRPGNVANTPFTNQVLKLVNSGKGGNLSTITMANIIGGISMSAPINTVPPALTYISGGTGAGTVGAQYARSLGTWTPSGGTPSQQWFSGGSAIAGSTAATYTVQESDSGNSIGCAVTMTLNGMASAPAMSNLVAIA